MHMGVCVWSEGVRKERKKERKKVRRKVRRVMRLRERRQKGEKGKEMRE